MGVFTFLKLQKWYQIAQNITISILDASIQIVAQIKKRM